MQLVASPADAKARGGVRLVKRMKVQALILSRPELIVLVEAPAGMGKSVLLAQLAAVFGPRIRQSLTLLIELNIRNGAFEAASLAGTVQEDLLSARLYAKKFLLGNQIEDADRVAAEFQEIAQHSDLLDRQLASGATTTARFQETELLPVSRTPS